MKPVYSTNEELGCGVITYGTKTFLVNFQDKDKVSNLKKTFFSFANEEDCYPSFVSNYQKISLLEFLYKHKPTLVEYCFENGDNTDLRSSNVKIYHLRHREVVTKYNVIDYNIGHFSSLGVDANVLKNPVWKIQGGGGGEIYLLMFCEKDTFCKLCPESYQKVLEFENKHNGGNKITWSRNASGYIVGTIRLYIHQVILDCYGNGKAQTL